MSTTNTETLKLYKNTKLYNGSRYKIYQGTLNNIRDIETVLGSPDYKEQVNYKSITEPITIRKYIDNCDQYTYGSITNHGKTYYIFVDNIMTDSYGLTTIDFTVDWWSTNWFDIDCTIAHLTRKPYKPQFMKQPISPLKVSITQTSLTSDYCFAATYIPSTEHGTSYISTLFIENSEYMFNMINNGHWYQNMNIPGADIKDCFAVPFISYNDVKTQTNADTVLLVKGNNESDMRSYLAVHFSEFVPFVVNDRYFLYNIDDNDYYTAYYNVNEQYNISIQSGISPSSSHPWNGSIYQERYVEWRDTAGYKYRYIQDIYRRTDNTVHVVLTKDLDTTFYSDEFKQEGIMDWNGNTIWEAPYNVAINYGFKVTLLKGLSHVLLQFTPYDDYENTRQGELITGTGFCYDCRHPGLFVDSYQDYVLKNRDYDIQMRQIQSNKQELQAWVSAAENVGFGYAFGDTGGAKAAGAGGIIEAVGVRAINSLYDPQIQSQYDRRYQLMTDQISLIGDSITNLQIEAPLSKYTLTIDNPSKLRAIEDINSNGFYTDETVSHLQSYFTNTTRTWVDNGVTFTLHPTFQADNVVVEGACNVVGKQEVVRRLQNGVEFI